MRGEPIVLFGLRQEDWSTCSIGQPFLGSDSEISRHLPVRPLKLTQSAIVKDFAASFRVPAIFSSAFSQCFLQTPPVFKRCRFNMKFMFNITGPGKCYEIGL